MNQVTAITQREKYKTVVQSGKHHIIVDEPIDSNGQDTGMSPGELLCGSLGSCTSITLRMYSDRKGWDIEKISVDVVLDTTDKANPVIHRTVALQGNLDEEQQKRMLAIANACPVHKLLERGIKINTEMAFE